MKQTIQKVEAVLNSLECGFKFTKEKEGTWYCLSGNPVIYAGMTLDWGLGVEVCRTSNGIEVEYQCAFESKDCDQLKGVMLCQIMQRGHLSKMEAEASLDAVMTILQVQYDSMLYRFGPEFERRLPDIHIADRLFTA